MSSWTDKMISFNPYVQEIPVEDYSRVALYKQEQYDRGVEKAQSYLDSINGIPVATEADKRYLDSLNAEFQNKARGTVSADFSKASLVNQFASMANKIARDPVIQNSTLSATRIQNLKNSFAELRKAKPELYSQKNEEWIEKNYLRPFYEQGRTETGLVYNGPTEAIRHTDYRKILSEELKKVDPTIQTTISPNGEFQYIVDKASKVTPAQIRGIVDSVISTNPDIQQQMQIDGDFAFENFDNQGLYNHVRDTYGEQISQYSRMATEIQDQMDANPNDIALIDKGVQQLKEINGFQADLANKRNRYLEGINGGNTGMVKQTLFADNFRDGMVLQFAKNNHDLDVKTNDAVVQKYKLDIDKANNWLKFVEMGIDPDTRGPITSENPLFATLQAMQETKKKNAKAAKAGEAEAEAEIQGVDVNGAVAPEYTPETHLEKIREVDGRITGVKENLKRQFANELGVEYDPTSKTLQDKFVNYEAEQARKHAEGDPTVDASYLDYLDVTRVDRLLKSSLQKFSESTGKKVDQFVKENNLTKEEPGGWGVSRKVGETGEWTGVIGAGLDMFGAGLDIATNVLTGKSWGSNAKKIMDYQNEIYKQLGRTTSFQGKPISVKESNSGTIKSMIVQSVATQTKEDGDTDDIPVLSEVLPISAYNNSDGSLSITYQQNKDNPEVKTIKVPSEKNVYGNPNPYAPIEAIIELNGGKTPQDPSNALASRNGKIKYAIIQNPLTKKYQLSLLRGNGRWYTIPSSTTGDPKSASFGTDNVGSIMTRVEQLSQLPKEQLEAAIQAQASQQ